MQWDLCTRFEKKIVKNVYFSLDALQKPKLFTFHGERFLRDTDSLPGQTTELTIIAVMPDTAFVLKCVRYNYMHDSTTPKENDWELKSYVGYVVCGWLFPVLFVGILTLTSNHLTNCLCWPNDNSANSLIDYFLACLCRVQLTIWWCFKRHVCKTRVTSIKQRNTQISSTSFVTAGTGICSN